MPAIISNSLRITNGDYFQNDVTDNPTFVFFGGTTPWNDESLPPDTIDSTEGRIAAFSEIVGLKRIFSTDIISVLPRTDWIEGDVYDEYTDSANIIDDKNPVTNDFYRYYVVTDEFNVYKCISNYKRTPSTIKPTGTPTSSFQTPDGYIWKYMYTILSNDAFKYMTPNWIPCYTLYNDDGSAQWQVQNSATPGSIEHIVVQNPGSGYSSSNLPTVTITGDGSGATAVAEVDDLSGEVDRIVMTNIGSDYTTASVSISGGDGAGAVATPILSPINGHGSNARVELGATYKMIRMVIDGDEGGNLPVNIDYRRSGIITWPKSNDSGVVLELNNFDLFSIGDTVTGGSSGATGVIRVYDKRSGRVFLESVTGTFTLDEYISSQTFNSAQVLNIDATNNLPITAITVAGSNMKERSGNLMYFSNREKITRGANQIEEFRFIISF